MKPYLTVRSSRLLEHLEEALLLLGPDLIVRELLSDAARELGRGPKGERELVGLGIREALAPLLAPRALRELLPQLSALLDASHEDSCTVRGVEGGASASVRAAGLTRYFDLSLRRFAADDGSMSLMLGIRDVTERLRLARALEAARQSHELAVAVLRTDPQVMRGYLQDAASSMSLIHSLLRMPARTQHAFRDKLGRILKETATLRAMSAQLAVGPIASQAAAYEAALEALRDSEDGSGDEFLPLAVQLDELFTLITTASQLAEQRAASQLPAADPAPPVAQARSADLDWPSDCSRRLTELVERVGAEQQHDARLEFNGLEEVPACYRRNVYHMLQQLVRNAIEHGIETPAERKAAGKATAGRITVDCSDRGEAGIEIIVRDDGRGFDTGLIGRVAVEKGLLTPEALARTDPRTLIGLIFRPGFSTEGIAGCAGKGLGMVFLRELVTRMDGQVSVSTKGARYTRFRVQLPDVNARRMQQSPQRVA